MNDANDDRGTSSDTGDGLAEVIAFPGARRAPGQGNRVRPLGSCPSAAEPVPANADADHARDWAPSLKMGEIAPANEATALAEERAVSMLRRADRSASELRDRLSADEELEGADIESVVAKMIDLGYLDDERLARSLVEQHGARKGKGRLYIERELQRRGIDREILAEALEGLDVDDELERATELVRSRLRSVAGLDRDAAKRRLIGYLGRRGYTGQIAMRAIDEAYEPAYSATGDSRSRVRFQPSD